MYVCTELQIENVANALADIEMVCSFKAELCL